MKKIILIYSAVMALLIFLLAWWDYRLMVHDITMEIYIAVIATFCTALGVWAGLKFTSDRNSKGDESGETANPDEFDISSREFEVLKLMAKGYSNKEIADELFISINTVKTHTSNLYSKLNASRRTQAVNEARRLRLI
jgi:DNA-binding CsgD family transcriptional regulator